MTRKFDYFVLFGEMRTGSNFLEANLNEFPGVTCHGEAFNPHFIGSKGQTELFGIDLEARAKDPLALLKRMQEKTDGLAGFRFFHDHDPRILAHVLPDPRCAKIILTRNPIDSYVSLQIASATGQWRLTDLKHHRQAQATFDAADFEAHLERLQSFQIELLHGLQISGQTAFYIAYEDVQDVAVLNGMARFMGVGAQIEAVSDTLKKQNPQEITEKVINPEEMEAALARLDRFNLSRTPNFEPRRGPSIPSFHVAARSPLLYMPMRGGPEDQVTAWLAALDGAPAQTGLPQKALRQWKRAHTGHRSFTVLRHPLARAHAAFCGVILSGRFTEIRNTLARAYKLPLPKAEDMAAYDQKAHRTAFLAFLRFLKGNLAGQSSVRIDPLWASQTAVLQGFAQFGLPDMILREEDLPDALPQLAARFNRPAPNLPKPAPTSPYELAQIYDAELEEAAQDAYQRDYMGFGFGPWSASAP